MRINDHAPEQAKHSPLDGYVWVEALPREDSARAEWSKHMNEIRIDTTPRSWDDALKSLMAPQEPSQSTPVVPRPSKPKTAEQVQRQAAADKAKRRKAFWGKVAAFLTNRGRDLALAAIVLAAFVGVFDGALYSARVFSFIGVSAIAFALMPDALMVLAAAKMRQVGITEAQHRTAKHAMHFGLAFSLVTNMIAALLRSMPELLQLKAVIITGSVAYHGVVVLILWFAVETLTKTRSDRKGRKASGGTDALGALAGVAKAVVSSKPIKARTSKNAGK